MSHSDCESVTTNKNLSIGTKLTPFTTLETKLLQRSTPTNLAGAAPSLEIFRLGAAPQC